ncbi:MAG: acyl-CoA dehydrogenase family protein [Acidimicrobiales bacterium]
MRFSFGADQIQFQAGVRQLLASDYPVAALRRDWQDKAGSWRDIWGRLADMGVTGLMVPEVHGGMGQDELSLVLILEEAGYAGLAAPLADSVAVATPLLVDLSRALPAEQAEHWLSEATAGRAVLGVGLGGPTHPYVQDADVVDAVVVARHGEVYLARPAELDLVRQPSIDKGRRLFEVGPDLPARARVAGGAEEAIEAAFDRAVLAGAAQMVGVAARLVEMAGAYASARKQFGQPIGSFQAVKHLMADALCRLEFARPVVYRAAHSVARNLPQRSRDVSAAKVFAGEAASVAARTALQVHGAIGYTWEADVHLWMKRAWALGADWGDETFHTDRVARFILGPLSS